MVHYNGYTCTLGTMLVAGTDFRGLGLYFADLVLSVQYLHRCPAKSGDLVTVTQV